MNYFNLILGLILIVFPSLYLVYVIQRMIKIGEGDYMRYSNFIKIFGSIIIFIALGLILIYKELK